MCLCEFFYGLDEEISEWVEGFFLNIIYLYIVFLMFAVVDFFVLGA